MGGQIPKIDDAPWPGFPADIISIALVVATQAEGTVLIHEKMFESRMFYVDKLIGMGAKIILCDPHRAVVTGPSRLGGSELVSPDVRARHGDAHRGDVRAGQELHPERLPDREGLREPHAAPAVPGGADLPQRGLRMRIPFWHVDAFHRDTVRRESRRGLPDGGLAGRRDMQKIAAENNLPETAFVVPRGTAAAELRWFTPAVEIDLCGHATLAAAHVIFGRGWPAPPWGSARRAGRWRWRGAVTCSSWTSRPAPPFPARRRPSSVRGLGRDPVEVRGARDYLAVYASEEDVRGLSPDMSQLARIDRMGVIATAPAADPRDCDFVSGFSPRGSASRKTP